MILPFITLMFISFSSAAQSGKWKIQDGRAIATDTFKIPSKDAGQLYREISRWLTMTFVNPEDHVKARIENEYLRGEGYHRNIIKPEIVNGADFKYTFSFEVQDGQVIFTLFNAAFLYTYVQDNDNDGQATNDGIYTLEESINAGEQTAGTKKVLTAITSITDLLFASLENHLRKK